ncbi:unnamed protein product [Rotaria sordida]|uniref:Uncharacterized protein n=1 Tax=Rotaria sordida TaxID=392033 RepID=A0A819GST8_9BILA|nr:unnamed protein product [Rotaria sordida]
MNQNNTSWICNSCNNSTNNLEMDIHKQVFLKCPSCLITCINPKVENNPLDNHICLRDMDDKEYNYGATALLCFSAYSDNVRLVKKKSNKYVRLIGDTFSEETSLAFSNLLDIFDTSSSILLFHQQVNIAASVRMFLVEAYMYKTNSCFEYSTSPATNPF